MGEKARWTRRQFLQKASNAALANTFAALLRGGPETLPKTRPPNILFIFPDELRAQSLGFMGEQDVRTPNIDRLAAEGIVLPYTFANTPVCCPARAAMLTGLYPHKHGVRINDMPLADEQVTIAEILRTHGYRTGFVGKWHLDGGPRLPGFVPPGGGRRQGFEWWAANECRHNYFDTWYFRDTPEMIPIEGYEAFTWTDLAIEFLRTSRGAQPFCLWVAYGPPHFPIPLSTPVAPPEYLRLYDPAKLRMRPNWEGDGTYGTRREDLAAYYAAITCIDEEIGRLMKVLDEFGLREETIVLLTSDHGDMMGSHGFKMKRKPWEESIRIPGIIRYPAKIKPGQRRNTFFTQVDMLPTLLGLSGLPIPSHLQGADLSPAILGRESQELHAVYFHNYEPYQQDHTHFPAWAAVRTARYKYARTEDKPWMLYDLEKDPYEMHNLANRPEHGKLQEQMEVELAEWMRRTDDSWKHDFREEVILYTMTQQEYQETMRKIRQGKL